MCNAYLICKSPKFLLSGSNLEISREHGSSYSPGDQTLLQYSTQDWINTATSNYTANTGKKLVFG